MAWWTKGPDTRLIEMEDHKKSILTLLKLDADALYDRVVKRKEDYLMILSLKRTRSHFPHVFRSKFQSAGIDELKFLSEETIVAVMNYYGAMEKLEWYLLHTEDLPKMIEDHVIRAVKELENSYNSLMLMLDAELL